MSSPLHAEAAAAAPAPLPAWPDARLAAVGQPQTRASAAAKVRGEAGFAADVVLPGMVHAVVLRSTIARGEVLTFDPSRALTVAGVLAVAGPLDVEWPPYPRRVRPVISAEVRFIGEEIGAVVAETEAAARRAARLVAIGYAAARACITPQQALAAGAPRLAEAGNIVGGAELLQHGDLAAAKAAAEVVVEGRYSTPAQHHAALEPHGCVAAWEGEALTLWDSSQGAHLIREWLAQALQMPPERVRVISRYVGGGFGSKIHLKPYHVIAAVMARRLGRPVRLFMNRRDEFVASHQRAASERQIAIGATRDGRLTFIDEHITGQAGPCRFLAGNAAGAANGLRLHRVDAVRAELKRVLTNTQAPVPFRGPMVAEDIFCLEQAIDEMAHALAIDPLALRLRNLADREIFSGLPYAGNQLERCYRLGAQAFGWQWRPPGSVRRGGQARGIGMGAVAYDATLYEPSRVEIARGAGGGFELRLGITEIGGGADTVFAQIAAEVLGVPPEQVATHFGDTASTPRSIDASNHSRTCAVVGPVVRAAAEDLKRQLQPAGAEHAGGGEVVGSAERERAPEGVLAAMFGAHFVEVEVDLASGRVAVVRAVCAHDAGRLLNPRLAEGQVHGGFLQGMGMALQEERLLDPRNGRHLNAALWAYRAPGMADTPPSIRFVDAGRPDGGNSIGVKGIGEPPLIAAGAAIANAVHNALGVRMRSYPITPAKVLAALGGLPR